MRASTLWTAALAALAFPAEAMADVAVKWQMGLTPPASPNMATIVGFNEWLFWIITAITAFVLVLLVYCMWRFAESRNPTPSGTTHNTMVEVLWTVVPVLILVGIAIPSFKQLYFLNRTPPDAEFTIKAIGHQWYWSYEYPDHGNIAFDAFMVPTDKLQPGQYRLLETDNTVVLPVDTNIRILTTADDVIHAWGVPAFGVKIDAVPGRTNETWVRIDTPGVYYGQCSELCGVNHGFMPIRVQAVSKEEFAKWVEEAKTKFAKDDGSSPKLAQATGE
jgi:cytochrome c oxidase subunit II